MTLRDPKIPTERHRKKPYRSDIATPKIPDWMRIKSSSGTGYTAIREIMEKNAQVTFCNETSCPSACDSWSQGSATMTIMGQVCTPEDIFCSTATGCCKHHGVKRFVTLEEFKSFETAAYGKAFLMASATPLTRQSYNAGHDFERLRNARKNRRVANR